MLARPGHENRIYTETMDEALTCDQIAGLMSEVFGRQIRYEAVPSAEWAQYMTDHWGVPLELSKSSIGTMRAIENGEFDIATHDYEAITGKKPQTMREFLQGVAASRTSAS